MVPEYALATDASLIGWGAVLLELTSGRIYHASGRWKKQYVSSDINVLEMTALELGLKKLGGFLRSPTAPLRLHLDNDAATAILAKSSAHEAKLNKAAIRVLRLLAGARPVTAVRIGSADNPADSLSRGGAPLGLSATRGVLGVADAGHARPVVLPAA